MFNNLYKVTTATNNRQISNEIIPTLFINEKHEYLMYSLLICLPLTDNHNTTDLTLEITKIHILLQTDRYVVGTLHLLNRSLVLSNECN